MGMFDAVQFNMRLPVKNDATVRSEGNPFQSKSIQSWLMPHLRVLSDRHGALTVTVDEDGRLFDHTGLRLHWSGTMNFYGPVPGRHKWLEFDARVKNGAVLDITTTGRQP